MPQQPLDLEPLRGLDADAVRAALGAPAPDALRALAHAALDDAESDTAQATIWLEVATALGAAQEPPPADAAWLDYARARMLVFGGRLADAETALLDAQSRWAALGDSASYARSLLGLTQICAMQGRYAEAEAAAQRAVTLLEPIAQLPELALQLAGARHNLGTLYSVQDQHAAALDAYTQAAAGLTALAPLAQADPDLAAAVNEELAHNALNRATALMLLDQPHTAADALEDARVRFTALNDPVNRGRATTNLGKLRLRTGDYAGAWALFAQATRDLLGVDSATEVTDTAALRVADELLLEQGSAAFALNLLPEAEAALTRALDLFASAGQPYEQGQALYMLALVRLRGAAPALARPLLDQALALFDKLDNRYWRNRTRLALAALDQQMGDALGAAARLDALLAPAAALDTGPAAAAPAWDTVALAEALILRGTLYAAAGQFDAARAAALEAARVTATPLGDDALTQPPPLPPQALRIEGLLGHIALRTGDIPAARTLLGRAVARLEAQRVALPLEELRTAFLDDKSGLYADLLLALLAAPTPSADEIRAAFDTVEQARSRTLLERLLATLEPADTPAPEAATGAALRSHLHWLYNQLLGEAGSRALDVQLTQALRDEEARIQHAEWQRAPLLAQAQPINLRAFQATLPLDKQALVYATAGDELLAFVVDQTQVQVVRQVCTLGALEAAYTEFRYQVGRAALGGAFFARHGARMAAAIRAALAQVYDLALAPLRPLLHAPRLLILPAGPLHGLPVHALWDGAHWLLETFEITVAPSASVAAQLAARPAPPPNPAWAGLAPDDPAIPAARSEVEAAARRFAQGRAFVGDAATRAALNDAAQRDILHLATHGLFRADNPFFSVLKLADGWIDVREIYRLPLRARWVVLSACESGVGRIHPNDEVIGLARGFMGAGASAIVATAWHIQDTGAAALMQTFYAALTQAAGVRPAAALRAAQQAAIAANEHPYAWAPFYVIGD